MVHTAAGYAKAATGARRWPAARRSDPARRTWSRAPRWRRSTACRCCCSRRTTTPPAGRDRCCSSSSILISFDESVNDCFRPVSRFFDRISRPEQLTESLLEAMRVLTDPAETGAVTIALPQDVQSEAALWPAQPVRAACVGDRAPPAPPRPRARRRRDAAGVLDGRSIIAGGGVHYSEAWVELAEFAETFGIPVGETCGRQGRLPRAMPACSSDGVGVTGSPAAAALARDADLVICIGTRLTDFPTGSRSLFQNPDVKFLAINVSGHDARKMGAMAVLADAREALRRSLERGPRRRPERRRFVRRRGPRGARRLAQAAERTRCSRSPMTCRLTQSQMLGNRQRPGARRRHDRGRRRQPSGRSAADVGPSGGRHAHIEFGYSCMGYEIAGFAGRAHGAAPGEVYTFIGDGTYLMNPSRARHRGPGGLKVTVLISRNHGFQCIRDLQLRSAGQDFGNEFRCRDDATNRLAGEFVQLDLARTAAGARRQGVGCQHGG